MNVPPLNGETTEVVIPGKGKQTPWPSDIAAAPAADGTGDRLSDRTEQCTCSVCGQEKLIIGYEESEQLEVEPAKYFVQVTKREKRACRCGRDGVVTAPAAKRIIEKGLVSDRMVIQMLVNKYCNHLPLYRQSVTLEQETGLELSRATMDGWVCPREERLFGTTS